MEPKATKTAYASTITTAATASDSEALSGSGFRHAAGGAAAFAAVAEAPTPKATTPADFPQTGAAKRPVASAAITSAMRTAAAEPTAASVSPKPQAAQKGIAAAARRSPASPQPKEHTPA